MAGKVRQGHLSHTLKQGKFHSSSNFSCCFDKNNLEETSLPGVPGREFRSVTAGEASWQEKEAAGGVGCTVKKERDGHLFTHLEPPAQWGWLFPPRWTSSRNSQTHPEFASRLFQILSCWQSMLTVTPPPVHFPKQLYTVGFLTLQKTALRILLHKWDIHHDVLI